jgi:hypothetical protein
VLGSRIEVLSEDGKFDLPVRSAGIRFCDGFSDGLSPVGGEDLVVVTV